MRKLIAIIDGGCGGHERTYVHAFARAATGLGYRVVVACPDAGAVPVDSDSSGNAACEYFRFNDSQWGLNPKGLREFRGSRLIRWNELKALINSIEAGSSQRLDAVLLLSLSHYLSPLISCSWVDKLIDRPIAGLHISPTWQLGPRPPFKQLRHGIFRDDWLLRGMVMKSIATLCEPAVIKLRQFAPGAHIVECPDFCDTSVGEIPNALLARLRAERGQRKIVLLTGALDHRKNIEAFVSLARIADPEQFLFVLAGRWSDSSVEYRQHIISQYLSDVPANLILHFERLPDEGSFNALIKESDIVWINYRNFFLSSNLLVKAASFAKPVLAQNYGTIGTRTRRFHLGVTAGCDDIQSMRSSLQPALNIDPCRLGYDETGISLCELHSIERLPSIVREMLWFLDQ